MAVNIFIFLIIPVVAISQNKLSCVDLKNGTFNSYPKNSSEHYLLYRDGEFQKEVNTKTMDTVLWKVNWINDCVYSLQYLSGSVKITQEQSDLYKKHKLVYEIKNVTPDYFVFTGYLDKISTAILANDTVWMKEKLFIPDNNLFQEVTKPSTLKKAHFSDTSKYAVLYIYRPGKVACSIVDNIIYFDDNLMCVETNKSAHIFKILKEGKFKIMAKANKKEAVMQLEVDFGKKYYLKAASKFGHCTLETCCSPQLTTVEEDKGATEFDDAQ
ncbi:MAG: hypothetical protein ABIO55_12915 [Ginsengibacter sp.]